MMPGPSEATLGGFWKYEAIELRQQHKQTSVIPVSQGGVPTYDELVLVTTQKYFENHVSLLRRLAQTIGRGYSARRARPPGAGGLGLGQGQLGPGPHAGEPRPASDNVVVLPHRRQAVGLAVPEP